MILYLPRPANLHGDRLAAELVAAGIADPAPFLDGIEVGIRCQKEQEAKVRSVVQAHNGQPTAADIDRKSRQDRKSVLSAKVRAGGVLTPAELAEAVTIWLTQ